MAEASKDKAQNNPKVEQDDDDDLDDLDDVLEQFNTPSAALQGKASSSVTPGTAASYDKLASGSADKGPSEPDQDDEDDDDEFESVFAAELAKEMEKMLGSLKPSSDDAGPSTSGSGKAGGAAGANEQETDEERQFRETFEKILASSVKDGAGGDDLKDEDIDLEQLSKLMNGLGAGGLPDASLFNSGKGKAKAKQGPAEPPKSFEETIKATMSRLSESEAGHKARQGAASASKDDPLAQLMAQMAAMGGEGDGPDDENLPELLDGLMDQLMSKELLYEPISELKTKYPEYLASGEAQSLPAEERKRYEVQRQIVIQIAEVFDSPDYDDKNKEQREKISNLMQQMQEAGAPPKHLLGELGPAMGLNPDGTPNVDPEACVVS